MFSAERRRSWGAQPAWLAVAPFLMVCSLYGGGAQPGPGARVPQATQAAAAAPATPTDYRDCGPGALPETGVQGQVPKADQESGRSRLGYRCNLGLVGEDNIDARGANIQLAWYRDCAYVGIIGVREFFPSTANPAVEGLAVIDASDPRRPKHVQTIVSPVGRNHHEGLEVNARRGMLVVQVGGISARYIEIYDVSEDCRRPRLKARYDSGRRIFHGLKISDDGDTIYATDGIGMGTPSQPLHIFDVSDMSRPRLLRTWGPGDALQPTYLIHDLDLSHDGTRAYLGASPPATALVGLGVGGATDVNVAPTVVTIDTTEIEERKPNPDLKVVSVVAAPNFGHTVQRAMIGGKPHLIASGESPFANGINCPWAWGHVVDMSDERNPVLVSQLKLEVNETRNCEAAADDDVTYSIHYAGVDDERDTSKIFYTYYGGGLRVFDVRDPVNPKEIAYYHPPPQRDTVLEPLVGTFGGDAQTPAWDSASSVVRYRPENGEIWFASIGGGLSIVRLTGDYACVPAAVRARKAALGDAVLGRTRRQQIAALAARPQTSGVRTRRGIDRFCTTDGRTLRVGYPTARLGRSLTSRQRRRIRGRAVFVLSSSPLASAGGIAPGAADRELRRWLRGERRLRVGNDTWYFARGGRTPAIYRTRRGLVREVGIADPRLTATQRAARRFLDAWTTS